MSSLEIHHINVSQGDATLILLRDLNILREKLDEQCQGNIPEDAEDYVPFAIHHELSLENSVLHAVLIDGGEDAYGKDVLGYMRAHGVKEDTPFTVIATHPHSDHLDGLRCVFWNSINYSTREYVPALIPSTIYHSLFNVLGRCPTTLTYDIFTQEICKLKEEYGVELIEITPGLEINIGIADEIPVVLRCIAANGYKLSTSFKRTITTPIKKIYDPQKSIDPNALSVCMVLEWGPFQYFLGGDIGGSGSEEGGNYELQCMDKNAPFYANHPNIEAEILPTLQCFYPSKIPNLGHICGLKANHHGSASSNDIHFLAETGAAFCVISCGVKPKYHAHPSKQTLLRLSPINTTMWQTKDKRTIPNTIQKVYITEMSKNLYNEIKEMVDLSFTSIMGDVVVRPFLNTENDAVLIQVYGTGELTNRPKIELCPVAINEDNIYPIGPDWLECKHGQ